MPVSPPPSPSAAGQVGADAAAGGRVPGGLGVALLGLAAGLSSGLFGVGGGAVIVPGLVLLFGVGEHVAHATSLAAIVLIAPAALASFMADGALDWAAVGLLLAGGVVGAVLGARLAATLPAHRLRQAFAVLVLVIGLRLLVGGGLAGAAGAASLGPGRALGLICLGLLAGVVSSALGVGGGVVLVPALVLAFGVAQHVAEGTSLAVIAPTALIGAWRHGRRGLTDWRLGAVIGAGGIAGGLLGARLALALPAATLGGLFGAFLLITGLRMAMGTQQRRKRLNPLDSRVE